MKSGKNGCASRSTIVEVKVFLSLTLGSLPVYASVGTKTNRAGEQRARSSGMGVRGAAAVTFLQGSRAASTAAMDGGDVVETEVGASYAMKCSMASSLPTTSILRLRAGCFFSCRGCGTVENYTRWSVADKKRRILRFQDMDDSFLSKYQTLARFQARSACPGNCEVRRMDDINAQSYVVRMGGHLPNLRIIRISPLHGLLSLVSPISFHPCLNILFCSTSYSSSCKPINGGSISTDKKHVYSHERDITQ
jgi:hypothetical protein